MPKVGAATGKHYSDGSPKRYGLTKSGKRKAPPSPAQRAAQERFKAGRAGGGGGGGIQPERGRGDLTPARAEPRALGSAFTLKINSVPVIRTQPADILAMAAALLFALRSVNVGLRDEQAAEREGILRQWFGGDLAVLGMLPGGAGGRGRVDLSDEVRFFHELFRAMPETARTMGFTAEEWVNAWNIIAGEALGALPSGPPVSVGMDGMFPPVRGTVRHGFNPPEHAGVDIPAPFGTPIIAPEDLLITGIKTDAEGYGLHIVAVSRRPEDGSYPRIISGGGTIESIMPAEGERRHIFGHLATLGAGLKRGDHVERGAIIGTVGSSGHSTGPHLHWRVDLWTKDGDGKIKMTPMDPSDLVPLDVVSGAAAVRPPAATWTIEDAKAPKLMRDVPAYNVWIGGDVINKGGKFVTGDVDVLSHPVGEPTSEFDEVDAYGKIASKLLGGAGTVIGGLYGGPVGAKLGGAAGKGLGKIGTDVVSDAVGKQ